MTSRLYLITYPRTASNLLMRILNIPDQPNVVPEDNGGYFFLPSLRRERQMGLFQKPAREWTDGERDEVQAVVQECFDRFLNHVQMAQAGQTVFVKEHAPFMIDPLAKSRFIYGVSSSDEVRSWKVRLPDAEYGGWKAPKEMPINETVIPDEFLATFFPTFLIRHPLLAFPSYYRAVRDFLEEEGDGELNFFQTLRWSRMLYDWYLALHDHEEEGPIVLDADDILTTPQVVTRYAERVGLDSTKLKFNWNPAGEEEMAKEDPNKVHMTDTLLTSSGILQNKASKGLSLEEEVVKWREEFGEKPAGDLERWVKEAMPDYEYLRNKRLVYSH